MDKPKMREYVRLSAECPFFQTDDGLHAIQCEGLFDKSKINIVFDAKRDWRNYIESKCCNPERGYKQCEYYRMLMGVKYGE